MSKKRKVVVDNEDDNGEGNKEIEVVTTSKPKHPKYTKEQRTKWDSSKNTHNKKEGKIDLKSRVKV
jgi:hypothetical protein